MKINKNNELKNVVRLTNNSNSKSIEEKSEKNLFNIKSVNEIISKKDKDDDESPILNLGNDIVKNNKKELNQKFNIGKIKNNKKELNQKFNIDKIKNFLNMNSLGNSDTTANKMVSEGVGSLSFIENLLSSGGISGTISLAQGTSFELDDKGRIIGFESVARNNSRGYNTISYNDDGTISVTTYNDSSKNSVTNFRVFNSNGELINVVAGVGSLSFVENLLSSGGISGAISLAQGTSFELDDKGRIIGFESVARNNSRGYKEITYNDDGTITVTTWNNSKKGEVTGVSLYSSDGERIS